MEIISQDIRGINFTPIGDTFIGDTSPWINYIPAFNKYAPQPHHLFFFAVEINIEFQYDASLEFRATVSTVFNNDWTRPKMEDLLLFAGQSIRKINDEFNKNLLESAISIPNNILLSHIQTEGVEAEIIKRVQQVLDEDFPSDKWN